MSRAGLSGQAAFEQAERLSRWGHYAQALAPYQQATERAASTSYGLSALLGLAKALSAVGRVEDAIAACHRATEVDARSPAAHAMLALLLADLGALDLAAAAAAEALLRDRGSAAVLNLNAAVALRAGRFPEAAAFARSVFVLEPYNQRALSIMTLCGLEQRQDPGRLDRLVHRERPAAPEGFQSIAAFNDALAAAATQSSRLAAAPRTKTLVGGERIDSLATLPPMLSHAVEHMFRSAASHYVQAAASPSPPLAPAPRRLGLRGWVNMLRAGDYEKRHIHESGWLSGTYYVEMPEAPAPIVLGGHDYGENLPLGPLLSILPQAGDLLLFPSYLYHEVPLFAGGGRRISVAVDLYPQGP